MGSNKLGIAFGASLIVTALVIACGGHEASDVLGAPDPNPTSTSTSGASTSGASTSGASTSGASTSGASTSGASTSGASTSSTTSTGGPDDACAPCANPPPGCQLVGGCSCEYVCVDAGGPIRCQWSKNDPCPAGSYCDAENCGQGVCRVKGTTESPQRQVQCGCDGVTYWNGTIAAKAGMPIRANNACPPDSAARCGGLAGITCGAGQSCNRQVKNKMSCGFPDGQGTCWHVPSQCPPTVAGGNARPCGVGTPSCSDQCTAVAKQGTWYEDASCPN